jgi:23S rRNA (uracil1939-C5)-methyltransferase
LNLLNLGGTERVLDLFCGIGNFTLPLAQRSAAVFGVEAVEAMVARGRENAARNGLQNVTFMAADLSKLSVNQLHQRCGRIDAILLDPPRDGAREIVSSIGQLAAKRIVYVSCNPATLARDAKLLAASGYQLDSLGVLDMFPHTAHVESMALFVRP